MKFFILSIPLIFYILAVLDSARIFVPEVNALRGFSDSIIMLLIFMLFYRLFKKGEIEGKGIFIIIFLLSVLSRFINLTGEGYILRGREKFFLLEGVEVILLFFLLFVKNKENFLIFALHPLPVLYSGGRGSIFTISLLLFILSDELNGEKRGLKFTRGFLRGLSLLLSLPGALLTLKWNIQKIKENFRGENFYETLGTLIVFLFIIAHFAGWEIPLFREIKSFLKDEPCNSILYRFVKPVLFFRFLGLFFLISSIAGNLTDTLAIYFMVIPSTAGGHLIFSLLGFKERSLSLKWLSISSLIQILYLEWGNECFPLFPYFLLQFGLFLFLYLYEKKL